MLLIELAGTTRKLDFLTDQECPHFVFVVLGTTKGSWLSGAKFGVPIAATTEGTGLKPGKWVRRLCESMTEDGDTSGRLFQHQLKTTRLFEFEHDFYQLLMEVQTTTTEIDKEMDVESSYGILRSTRRGMTAHARNMKVCKDDLKTFNQWSQKN